jgi:hypothetical protein
MNCELLGRLTKVFFAMQIPTKEQVQALSEDLKSRSKIPGEE